MHTRGTGFVRLRCWTSTAAGRCGCLDHRSDPEAARPEWSADRCDSQARYREPAPRDDGARHPAGFRPARERTGSHRLAVGEGGSAGRGVAQTGSASADRERAGGVHPHGRRRRTGLAVGDVGKAASPVVELAADVVRRRQERHVIRIRGGQGCKGPRREDSHPARRRRRHGNQCLSHHANGATAKFSKSAVTSFS